MDYESAVEPTSSSLEYRFPGCQVFASKAAALRAAENYDLRKWREAGRK